MAKSDDMEDLNKLIDRAVDTFFVEAPDEDELALEDDSVAPGMSASPSESFEESEPSSQGRMATSGDLETDRAIDLAVDTLFVEEPDAATPETAEVEVEMEELAGGQEPSDQYPAKEPTITVGSGRRRGAETALSENALAQEIQREILTRQEKSPQAVPLKRGAPAPRQRPVIGAQQVSALVKLQEAILTLEWEISPRSVMVLSNELARLRARFHDNVTMDFGALAMRLVLDYVAKRMSRAHPESIRFLLVVAGLLHMNATSGGTDPLAVFHQILTRYESFKMIVRKAEGLPERTSASIADLAIDDPESFSKMVAAQAMTLLNAGKSLAKRLNTTDDSRNLIRSFRFLVTRSANRILEHTHKKRIDRNARKK